MIEKREKMATLKDFRTQGYYQQISFSVGLGQNSQIKYDQFKWIIRKGRIISFRQQII